MRLKKYFNRTEPNMPVIITVLTILAVVTVFVATGLGPVVVETSNHREDIVE